MKSAWRHALAGLFVLCCGSLQAASYPNERQLRSAIGAGAAVLEAEGIKLEMFDAKQAGVTRPLLAAGLSLTSGSCIVFYNTQPEDGLIQFFGGLEERDMPIWLDAIAVHEATHCIEQREAYLRRHFDKVLPPDREGKGMTVQDYLSLARSGELETWGEALADIASVLYLKQAVPERWAHFAEILAAMRSDFAERWPLHDTSAWLRQVIAANAARAADQSIFEAAFQMRRQYQPQ